MPNTIPNNPVFMSPAEYTLGKAFPDYFLSLLLIPDPKWISAVEINEKVIISSVFSGIVLRQTE